MQLKTFHALSREGWRGWLKRNHNKETKVGLIKYKVHTGKPTLTHQECMDEAICFGWIDTTVKRIDDERYMIRFARRNEKSRWSNATLGYARRLIEEKRMTTAGLRAYKQGLQKPVIDHGLPKNPVVPSDLKEALEKNKKARDNFYAFAPSYRRYYIYWIEKAKRTETRKKRIREVVKRSAENRKQ